MPNKESLKIFEALLDRARATPDDAEARELFRQAGLIALEFEPPPTDRADNGESSKQSPKRGQGRPALRRRCRAHICHGQPARVQRRFHPFPGWV